MIITIEGVDQSGKTVQSKMLTDRLLEIGVEATLFSFPDYTTVLGRKIKESLAAESVDIQRIHTLLAENRRERLPDIQQALYQNKIIVMNRYYESNMIYGMANGLDVQWLKDLDFDMPKSDMVILLDISASESFRRKHTRDIFETDVQFMENVVDTYRIYAEQEGWRIIDGTQTPKLVHDSIWDTLKLTISKLTNMGES
ncbi:MAG: dTMP kinase [Cenarchaeum sp. SB0663_bin_5]|nr:dTMP kinase [Cenarchaeum sp. SB0663_bin_5]MYH04597.1 dTMP kinase [Cenarchaeum sp. SB0675_bin_21]